MPVHICTCACAWECFCVYRHMYALLNASFIQAFFSTTLALITRKKMQISIFVSFLLKKLAVLYIYQRFRRRFSLMFLTSWGKYAKFHCIGRTLYDTNESIETNLYRCAIDSDGEYITWTSMIFFQINVHCVLSNIYSIRYIEHGWIRWKPLK